MLFDNKAQMKCLNVKNPNELHAMEKTLAGKSVDQIRRNAKIVHEISTRGQFYKSVITGAHICGGRVA